MCMLHSYVILEVALEREVEGDLFLQDIGQGFGFRPGSFDGAIRFLSSSSFIPSSHRHAVYQFSNGC